MNKERFYHHKLLKLKEGFIDLYYVKVYGVYYEVSRESWLKYYVMGKHLGLDILRKEIENDNNKQVYNHINSNVSNHFKF